MSNVIKSAQQEILENADLDTSDLGYQILPSGLIIQWGRFTRSGNSTAVAFPIPFPNECVTAVVAGNTASGEAETGVVFTTTTLTMIFDNASSATAGRFIAIGY